MKASIEVFLVALLLWGLISLENLYRKARANAGGKVEEGGGGEEVNGSNL